MTKIWFKDNEKTVYTLPDIVCIAPEDILDNHTSVYRVVIGKIGLSEEEAAAYKPLFSSLTTRVKNDPYCTDIYIAAEDKTLWLKFVYITETRKFDSVLYELEAGIGDIEYCERM